MKLSLKYIMVIAVLVMFVLTVLVPCVIESPKDLGKIGTREHSIMRSGLPPKGDWLLVKSIIIVVLCIAALFFYAKKLDKSLTCENDVLRLRRYLRIYHYLLIAGVLLTVAQITLAFFGLFTIQHIRLAHIFHSRLLEGLIVLLIFISFFLFTRRYIKVIQTVPPSVVLTAKGKDCPLL